MKYQIDNYEATTWSTIKLFVGIFVLIIAVALSFIIAITPDYIKGLWKNVIERKGVQAWTLFTTFFNKRRTGIT